MLADTCGQLLVAGFHGKTLPNDVARDLGAGRLGGVVLFGRNLEGDARSVRAITSAVVDAARSATAAGEAPPFIAVDQEGGRVARLKSPVLALPAMLTLAATADEDLVRRAGAALGGDLARLGFSCGFSPVLDVLSNPANPVIGDRAFGTEPLTVARFALAFAEGLKSAGVAPCGKHFPGHGDTAKDSHHELPIVDHPRSRLASVELLPFTTAIRAHFPALMSSHVLYPALDAESPATLSPAIATKLLREELGFRGVLFSDDLEMKALALPMEEIAVRAVRAGCDALLVCSQPDLVVSAREALIRAAEASSDFRARVVAAAARFATLRREFAPNPERDDAVLDRWFQSTERTATAAAVAAATGGRR